MLKWYSRTKVLDDLIPRIDSGELTMQAAAATLGLSRAARLRKAFIAKLGSRAYANMLTNGRKARAKPSSTKQSKT